MPSHRSSLQDQTHPGPQPRQLPSLPPCPGPPGPGFFSVLEHSGGHPPESLLLALHRPGVPTPYVATWHVASFPPPLRSHAPRSEKPLIKHRLRSTLHPRGSRVSALLLSPALVTPSRVINLSVPRLPVFSSGMRHSTPDTHEGRGFLCSLLLMR